MLGILLRLLGALGILLLAVLGIVLLFLLLVLFVPVSYSLDGARDAERTDVRMKLRWLFGLVQADIRYPTPGTIRARVLGIRVFDSGKTSKQTEKKGKKKGSADGTGGEDKAASEAEAKKAEAEAGTGTGTATASEAEVKKAEAGKAEPDAGTDPASSADAEKTEPKDSDGAGDAASASFSQTISEKADQARDRAWDVVRKLNTMRERASFYWNWFQEEDTRQLLLHGFFRLGRILRGLRPRVVSGWIRFGTGSPDTTGYCMALYGMLSPGLGENITLTPDFEEAVLEGECKVKGYVSAASILFHSGRVVLDRHFRKAIKSFKKGG